MASLSFLERVSSGSQRDLLILRKPGGARGGADAIQAAKSRRIASLAENMERTRHVPHTFATATMTALAGLLASIAWAAPARAGCVVARTSAASARLPDTWRAAVEDLIRSTGEAGHPWSCSGG